MQIHKKWSFELPTDQYLLQVLSNGTEFACIAATSQTPEPGSIYIHLPKQQCGPFQEVIFIDYSPNDERLFFAVRHNNTCSLWVNGRLVQTFQEIEQIYFLPDGSLFLQVLQKGKYYVFLYEQKLKIGPLESIVQCITTPNSDVAVAAYKGKRMCSVFINETEVGLFKEVVELQYNPASGTIFFLAETSKGIALYTDEKLYNDFTKYEIKKITTQYTTTIILLYKKKKVYVFDGQYISGPWEKVDNFITDGNNIAFTASAKQQSYVVVANRQWGPFQHIDQVRFFSDSGQITYIATEQEYSSVLYEETVLVQAPQIHQYWLAPHLFMAAFSFQYNNEYFVQFNASVVGPLTSIESVEFSPHSPHFIVNGFYNEKPCFISVNSSGVSFQGIGKAYFTDDGELVSELFKESALYIWYQTQQIGPFTSVVQRQVHQVKKPFYITKQDEKLYIVYNNIMYGSFREIEKPIFNDYGEPACAILREDGWYIFREFKQLGPFLRIAKYFWGPGNVLLTVAQTNNGWFIFTGDTVHGPFQGVGRVLFSPLSMVLGASVTYDRNISIYLNGQYFGNHGAIWSWEFTNDGFTHIVSSYDEATGLDKIFICIEDKHVIGSQIKSALGGGYIYINGNTVYLLRSTHKAFADNMNKLYEQLIEQLPDYITENL